MSTACAKVLGTCGLLEAILEPLAFQELILVQRVSRQFKSVIDGSVVLQQKLYRFPVQGGETSMHPLMAVLGPTGKADNVDNGKDKSWWSMYATQPPVRLIIGRARLLFVSVKHAAIAQPSAFLKVLQQARYTC